MKYIILFGLFLVLLTGVSYSKEVVISNSNYDTNILTIETGDTVTADTDLSFSRCGEILNKLGYIVTRYSDKHREVVNKTGYCNFYLYIKKNGIKEVIYK